MKRRFRLPGLVLALLLLLPMGAQAAGKERILAFDSRVSIADSGSLTVGETIRVLATGESIRHGLVREFPTKYKSPSGDTVTVGFRLLSVRQDGEKAKYRVENVGNGKKIYIGDKDTLVAPGEHVYELVYDTDGQIGLFADHDELYWNVTGNDWRLPIDTVTATVSPPPGAPVERFTAYTGPQGARGRDFTAEQAGGVVRFTTTKALPPGQGLSVVVAWPKGFVREPSPTAKILAAPASAVATAGLVAVVVYFFVAWLFVGRDPRAGTRIPLFAPPNGVSAPAARYLQRMGFDDEAFAAGLVEMAVAGGLRIEDTDGAYVVSRAKTPFAKGSWQDLVADKLLGARGNVLKLTSENHARVSEARKRLREILAEHYDGSHFKTNTGAFVLGVLLSIVVLVVTALRAEEPAAAAGMLVWVGGWSFAVAGLGGKVVRAMRQARHRPGVVTVIAAFFTLLFALPFFLGELVGLTVLGMALSLPAILCLAVVAGLNGLFWHLLKAPTKEGRRVMDALDGFRMYLAIGEKERLNLRNPPERTPALFEKFLPYAMALGVATAWAAQFEDVLAQAAIAGYTPGWYAGPSWDDHDFGGFADSLGGAFSSAISSAAVAPGSSSGFDGGGGGGGGSGGGGGGGGGGGW